MSVMLRDCGAGSYLVCLPTNATGKRYHKETHVRGLLKAKCGVHSVTIGSVGSNGVLIRKSTKTLARFDLCRRLQTR
jgi:hypothetical protein